MQNIKNISITKCWLRCSKLPCNSELWELNKILEHNCEILDIIQNMTVLQSAKNVDTREDIKPYFFILWFKCCFISMFCLKRKMVSNLIFKSFLYGNTFITCVRPTMEYAVERYNFGWKCFKNLQLCEINHCLIHQYLLIYLLIHLEN